jgi:integrase
VLKVLMPIWNKKPETASRLRGRIEAILASAQVEGWIDENRANPARWKNWLGKKLPNPTKIGRRGNHPAMPYADVPDFMTRLRGMNGVAAKALMFTILTAKRSTEVREMTWAEVNLDTAVWIIPARRMKAGKEHREPLSDAAVEILRGQAQGKNPYVFPSPIAQGGLTSKIHPIREVRSPTRRADAGGSNGPHHPLAAVALARVLSRMKVEGVTVHGFRSAFRDWVNEKTSFQSEIAEAALAHLVGNAVERAYRRGDALEKRRALMSAWASYCLPVEAEVIDYATWKKR